MGSQPPLRGGTSQPSSQNRGPGTCRQLAGLMWGVQGWPRPRRVRSGAHLLRVLLFHRLEVGAQVHGHLVLGAQQGAQHGVGRDADAPQGGALELPAQVQHLELQVLDLRGGGSSGLRAPARPHFSRLQARPSGTPRPTICHLANSHLRSILFNWYRGEWDSERELG